MEAQLRLYDEYTIEKETTFLQIDFTDLLTLNLHNQSIKMLVDQLKKDSDKKTKFFFEKRLLELLKDLKKKQKISYKFFQL